MRYQHNPSVGKSGSNSACSVPTIGMALSNNREGVEALPYGMSREICVELPLRKYIRLDRSCYGTEGAIFHIIISNLPVDK